MVYGLNAADINRLQRIQNRAAKLVFKPKSVTMHHLTCNNSTGSPSKHASNIKYIQLFTNVSLILHLYTYLN